MYFKVLMVILNKKNYESKIQKKKKTIGVFKHIINYFLEVYVIKLHLKYVLR